MMSRSRSNTLGNQARSTTLSVSQRWPTATCGIVLSSNFLGPDGGVRVAVHDHLKDPLLDLVGANRTDGETAEAVQQLAAHSALDVEPLAGRHATVVGEVRRYVPADVWCRVGQGGGRMSNQIGEHQPFAVGVAEGQLFSVSLGVARGGECLVSVRQALDATSRSHDGAVAAGVGVAGVNGGGAINGRLARHRHLSPCGTPGAAWSSMRSLRTRDRVREALPRESQRWCDFGSLGAHHEPSLNGANSWQSLVRFHQSSDGLRRAFTNQDLENMHSDLKFSSSMVDRRIFGIGNLFRV